MILPPLRYLRPHTVAEAVGLLAGVDGATVLAGGQTLINALKLDLVQPTALVDVHWLDELRGITVSADGTVTIGAASTYAAIAAAPEVRTAAPHAAAMAAGLVDRQVRNRGTIGGNVCLNDPTNNFPPLLAALEARMHVAGRDGARVLEASEFFTGTLATAVLVSEVLFAVELPPLPRGSRVVHRHLQVGADSWAVARAVVRLDVMDGLVAGARVVLGAVLGSPQRLRGVERAIAGRPADRSLAEAAVTAFGDELIETVGDVHCSAEYRREMARVQMRRALRDAVEGRNE